MTTTTKSYPGNDARDLQVPGAGVRRVRQLRRLVVDWDDEGAAGGTDD